jgi:hypothetical protein
MFFRRLLFVSFFFFPFLCLFYGSCSSDREVYCNRHNSGSSEFLSRTHDALVPFVISGSECTSKEQINLQKNFSSGTGLFCFAAALIILFSSVIFISCTGQSTNKYLRRLMLLQTLK